MVASLGMRAIRELPLVASLILLGAALFFGGGPGYGSLPWLGGGALLAILAALGLRGVPGGWPALLPAALLVAWLALSISWSILPDRSWDYANRGLVYLLFATLGLWLADRRRELALGLMALLAALIVWSLLGKVLPFVYDYGPPGVGRLRGPVGLWNQLALLTDFALVLALWRRRVEGALLAYAALVALLLTYSRGGLLTAVLLVAAWFALDRERVEGARTLLAGAVPAAAVVGLAFALPGVTGDGQSLHVRWRDGLIFGALLAIGAVATVLLRRVPLPRVSRRVVVTAAVVGVAALCVVVVVKGGGSGAVGNGGGRLANTSSNFRFAWWRQAVDGWQHHRLAGTGAGTFELTNLRYRLSYLDKTIEPHSLPLQFLTEAGIVGALLFVLMCASLLRPLWRRPRGHELALALLFPAYLVHGLVDVGWDFVAVSAPAFLVAGALVGRAPPRPVSSFAQIAGAGRRAARVLRSAPPVARRAVGERGARRVAAIACGAAREPRALRRPAARRAVLGESVRRRPAERRPAHRVRLLRPGRAPAAAEPANVALGRGVRVRYRLLSQRVHVSRALHGARPEGASE